MKRTVGSITLKLKKKKRFLHAFDALCKYYGSWEQPCEQLCFNAVCDNTSSLLSYLMIRKSLYPVIVCSFIPLSLYDLSWLTEQEQEFIVRKQLLLRNSRSPSGFITKQYTYSTSLISMDYDCISRISEVWGCVWDNPHLKCQRLIWTLYLAERHDEACKFCLCQDLGFSTWFEIFYLNL